MELVRWEPFEGLNRLHSRINDLFDENFSWARALPSATAGIMVTAGGHSGKQRRVLNPR